MSANGRILVYYTGDSTSKAAMKREGLHELRPAPPRSPAPWGAYQLHLGADFCIRVRVVVGCLYRDLVLKHKHPKFMGRGTAIPTVPDP